MVRSTCKVVVRLKPKDDPLDTAVQCIDNIAVGLLLSARSDIVVIVHVAYGVIGAVDRNPHCLSRKEQTTMACIR